MLTYLNLKGIDAFVKILSERRRRRRRRRRARI
jgi:hypothetical protein